MTANAPRPTTTKRAYTMTVRSAAAEETTRRIQTAAAAQFAERPFAEVTLKSVAERAGVSLQTVLRKFGSKEALFADAASTLRTEVFAARVPVRSGDVRAAVVALVASYEAMGDLGWRGLCQEDQFDFVKESMARARAGHRAWVESCLADLLPVRRGKERERRVLLLFAATDFYLWKLFRRDLAIGRAATVERIIELVEAASRG